MSTATPLDQDEPLMTAQDVARLLQVSLSTVYELRRTNKLPGIPIGSIWRFNPGIVRAFARGEVQAPTPPSAPVLPIGPRRRV
jgi:excisionase family DNA binding protein